MGNMTFVSGILNYEQTEQIMYSKTPLLFEQSLNNMIDPILHSQRAYFVPERGERY